MYDDEAVTVAIPLDLAREFIEKPDSEATIRAVQDLVKRRLARRAEETTPPLRRSGWKK